MSDRFPIHRPVNAMQDIVQEFLEGAPFTEPLCNKVIQTYTLCNDISYKRQMELAQQVLNQSKCGGIGNNFFAIESDFQFADVDTAVLIRLVNLCYHGERIITLNNSIIYIPKEMKRYTEEEIRIYVHRNVRGFKKSRLSTLWTKFWNLQKQIRSMKKQIRSIKSSLTRLKNKTPKHTKPSLHLTAV